MQGKIGDPLDLTGATLLMDGATLLGMNWRDVPDGPATPDGYPAGRPDMSPATRWAMGYNNRYAENPDGTGRLLWSGVDPDHETGAFQTTAGNKVFGGSVFSSPGTQGPLVIQPRLPTPPEQASWNQRGSDLNRRKFVSGAGVTFADALSPPYFLDFEATIPNQTGLCPAFWSLNDKSNWPRGEIDWLEATKYPSEPKGRMTTSIHTVDNKWIAAAYALAQANGHPLDYYVDGGGGGYGSTNEQESKATMYLPYSFDPTAGPHRYGGMVYPDFISVVWDRKIVWIWPTPAEMKLDAFFALFDYAIGSNSWFGTWPGGTPPRMTISDFKAYRMPASYGTGVAIPPVQPPPVQLPPVQPPAGVTAAQLAAIAAVEADGLTALASAQTAMAKVRTMIAALKPAS